MCGRRGCGFGGEWEEDAVVASAFVEHERVEVEVLLDILLAFPSAHMNGTNRRSSPHLRSERHSHAAPSSLQPPPSNRPHQFSPTPSFCLPRLRGPLQSRPTQFRFSSLAPRTATGNRPSLIALSRQTTLSLQRRRKAARIRCCAPLRLSRGIVSGTPLSAWLP